VTRAAARAIASPSAVDTVAAILRGEHVSWRSVGLPPREFLRLCDEQHVTVLVGRRIDRLASRAEWPDELRDELTRRARAAAAAEALTCRELQSVLDALAAEGVFPILLKGTALAYTIYEAPSLRPRFDTDLLIDAAQLPILRRTLEAGGYAMPLHCEGELLFCQVPLRRTDAFGVEHRLDCHWKISTQAVFADVLTYEDAERRAVRVPPLGEHARALGSSDALLLACIHPVMHHRNADPLIWTHDVHLLASSLTGAEFDRVAAEAVAKGVSAICARQLAAAAAALATPVPERIMRTLAAGGRGEPSAAYLAPNRAWIDEVVSSVRGLPRWRDRLRLVREIVLPAPQYMLGAYRLATRRIAWTLLPFLYLHRLAWGAWKIVAGRK
jgi:putative nucleotidyltransferase-like protein